MNDDEGKELAALNATFKAFVEQYARDEERKEVSRIEDREDRRKWRDEVTETVGNLERKIDPVVRHHQMAINLLKFLTPSGIIGGIVWVWQKVNGNQ
mgnify:CR=1 FL=1